MTTTELLTSCRQAGIELKASGDRLTLRAPQNAVTPELRDQLRQRKVEILQHLAAPRLVTLYPTNLVLPQTVIDLAWGLERRGFRISLVGDDKLTVEPHKALTEADQIALTKWHDHIVALTQFCDEVEVT